MQTGDLDDFLDLLELVAAEKRYIGTEAPIDRARKRAQFLERLDSDGWGSLLAVVSGGAIVGQIGLKDMRGLIEIGMLVTPNLRGRGIGSALLTAGLDWARQRDAYKMTLQCGRTTRARGGSTQNSGSSRRATSNVSGNGATARSGTRSSWGFSCRDLRDA